MARSTSANPNSTAAPHGQERVWDNLKAAIASSSGFQSWKREQQTARSQDSENLDSQVCEYLRETLETLAY